MVEKISGAAVKAFLDVLQRATLRRKLEVLAGYDTSQTGTVSDTDGKAVAIVDVDKDVIVKTLRFESEIGMPQYDSVARKVYVCEPAPDE
jgi:hypothetical protein